MSNFSPQHLKTLIEHTDVVPAVNQVELHPFFIQRDLREINSSLRIVTQSWPPLGGSVPRVSDANAVEHPLEHPAVIKVAAEYRKTLAQVVLRWHVDHGLSAIPKSVRPERIVENISIFDFALNGDDIAAINALDTGVRRGPNPDEVNAKTWD